MTGKARSTSRHSASSTGKAGNDSGSNRREAMGEAAGRSGRGKHPPNRIFTTPQTEKKEQARVHRARSSRQSEQGKRPR